MPISLKKKLPFLVLAMFFLLIACADMGERDNPTDPSADNFSGYEEDLPDSSSNKDVGKSSSSNKDVGKSSSSKKGSSSSAKNISSSCSSNKENNELSSSDRSSSSLISYSSSFNPKSSSSQRYVDYSYGKFHDDRDGRLYKSVMIGKQVWMAENLNYATGESFCYDDDEENCDKYGRLYTWGTAMDSAALFSSYGYGCGSEVSCTPLGQIRGPCPSGWHLPSLEEFETLLETVGGRSEAGIKLKTDYTWKETGVNQGIDSEGFTALAAGARYVTGAYENEGTYAFFWSSTEITKSLAYAMQLHNTNAGAIMEKTADKKVAYSVRCVEGSAMPYDDYSSSAVISIPEESSSSMKDESSSSSSSNYEDYFSCSSDYSSSSSSGPESSSFFDEPACSIAEHNGTNTNVVKNWSGTIGNYGYQLKYSKGNAAAVFYSDGSFSCSATATNSLLCMESIRFTSSPKKYSEFRGLVGKFYLESGELDVSADSLSYANIGVFGWMMEPAIDFYIVENTLETNPNLESYTKVGDYSLDGYLYSLYKKTSNKCASGASDCTVYYALNNESRYCGYVSVASHFIEWEHWKVTLGSLFEMAIFAEIVGSGVNASVDFTRAQVYVINKGEF